MRARPCVVDLVVLGAGTRIGTKAGLIGLALAFLGLGVARGFSARTPDMPGPTRVARDDARLTSNDDCVACHEDIAREWQGSLHRQSFTDPMFQAAFAREGKANFCQGCHAPEADPRATLDLRDGDAEIGVGCVGCHLVEGEILAAPAAAGVIEQAPHPLRREPSFAGAEACAGCHEFRFPAAHRAGRELKMQRTVSEHARSPAHDEACQRCHMPPSGVGGQLHRSHAFTVANDPRMLGAAAVISAARTPAAIEVTLEPRALGHAFPTGDLFRRLLVSIDGQGQAGQDCGQLRYLARHFGAERLGGGGAVKIELDDDRVGVGRGPRVVRFELPPACEDVALRWSVRYQRVLDAPLGAERRADVWDERVLAGGSLAPGCSSAKPCADGRRRSDTLHPRP